ncbi:MAG: hypothetical protein AB7F28_06025 [Candidatus Margulisiibacteriota bacterium]
MDRLIVNSRVDHLCKIIANELANRNQFPVLELAILLDGDTQDNLVANWKELFGLIKDYISIGENFRAFQNWDPKPHWAVLALNFGYINETYNLDKITLYIGIGLVEKKRKSLDEHIQNLCNTGLLEKIRLSVDDNFLVDLSNPKLEIRSHGVIVNRDILVYPHEFFRRYYSSNFLGMPGLLKKAQKIGLRVYIRLDPFRLTSSNHYLEISEKDHWYGPPFSEKILKDLYSNTRVVHRSTGKSNLSYDVQFTVFRTKMMDASIREFMIEEYCPIQLFKTQKSPGIGDEYCIQKFAHFCYDQIQDCFTHLDGAVRVFTTEEYKRHFQAIEHGQDVEEKIGTRHKMFLLEGAFTLELTQEILTEWFRFNPHIAEYFSGITLEPWISYDKINEMGI